MLDEAAPLENEFSGKFQNNFRAMREMGNFYASILSWAAAESYFAKAKNIDPEKFKARIEPSDPFRQTMIYVMGVDKACDHLPIKVNPCAAKAPEDEPREYVFVSGMPRAGTTATGSLLNLSPDITIFTEIYSPFLAYSPECFSHTSIEQRINQLESVGKLGSRRITLLRKEFDESQTARFVGDKRPLFHLLLPQNLRNMAGSKVTVLHILRDFVDTAASYVARAVDENDHWSSYRGVDQFILEINITNKFLVEFIQRNNTHPTEENHNIVYLDYEKMFSSLDYVENIFSLMYVKFDNSLREKVVHFLEGSRKIHQKDRMIPTHLINALREGIDMKYAEELCTLTGIDMLGKMRA